MDGPLTDQDDQDHNADVPQHPFSVAPLVRFQYLKEDGSGSVFLTALAWQHFSLETFPQLCFGLPPVHSSSAFLWVPFAAASASNTLQAHWIPYWQTQMTQNLRISHLVKF